MNVPGKKIRVLVADDSAFMRKVLVSIIGADPQLEVAGEARDGRDCVAQSEALTPDVITMDINMPHMDGLQATEVIMSSKPRPIVIVSSESREGADTTLKALELGAIDFIAKPSSGIDLDMNSVRDDLCKKLKMASKVRVVRTAAKTKLAQEISSSAPRTEPSLPSGYAGAATTLNSRPAVIEPARPSSNVFSSAVSGAPARTGGRFPLIMIAASTGGPATLMKFVPSFPKDFPAAVLLVQHMPASFTSQFSQQLAEIAAIRVKEAEPGEIIAPGNLYLCPGSGHMRVSQTGRLTLDEGARINGYRPCADVTLETGADFAGNMGIGVVLTGMGNDGCRGVQAIKAVGGYVIAQDEATSVIFGMNAEAIKTGAVDQILPIENIYNAVEKRVLYIFGASKVGAL
ncbi:MAG: Chemotaxis response regulator protein-glutamate methylesterase [Candidatus Angelobacter sp.]|jgi:two-component system chemotaxis response regulator CheB|nr:Chemotaxis response regulator protein-glutamate methylesterase [Candidatus Angelobacter sp.]